MAERSRYGTGRALRRRQGGSRRGLSRSRALAAVAHPRKLRPAAAAPPPLRHLALLEQRHALQLRGLGVPLENVDATAAQFGRSWRKAPQYIRLLLLVGAPLFGLWLAISGSRSFIARNMEVNDLPDPDDAFMPDAVAAIDAAVVHDRDRLLCTAIAREAAMTPDRTKTIAVLWGAGDMPAVAHFVLGPLGYRVAIAEWVTVFVP